MGFALNPTSAAISSSPVLLAQATTFPVGAGGGLGFGEFLSGLGAAARQGGAAVLAYVSKAIPALQGFMATDKGRIAMSVAAFSFAGGFAAGTQWERVLALKTSLDVIAAKNLPPKAMSQEVSKALAASVAKLPKNLGASTAEASARQRAVQPLQVSIAQTQKRLLEAYALRAQMGNRADDDLGAQINALERSLQKLLSQLSASTANSSSNARNPAPTKTGPSTRQDIINSVIMQSQFNGAQAQRLNGPLTNAMQKAGIGANDATGANAFIRAMSPGDTSAKARAIYKALGVSGSEALTRLIYQQAGLIKTPAPVAQRTTNSRTPSTATKTPTSNPTATDGPRTRSAVVDLAIDNALKNKVFKASEVPAFRAAVLSVMSKAGIREADVQKTVAFIAATNGDTSNALVAQIFKQLGISTSQQLNDLIGARMNPGNSPAKSPPKQPAPRTTFAETTRSQVIDKALMNSQIAAADVPSVRSALVKTMTQAGVGERDVAKAWAFVAAMSGEINNPTAKSLLAKLGISTSQQLVDLVYSGARATNAPKPESTAKLNQITQTREPSLTNQSRSSSIGTEGREAMNRVVEELKKLVPATGIPQDKDLQIKLLSKAFETAASRYPGTTPKERLENMLGKLGLAPEQIWRTTDGEELIADRFASTSSTPQNSGTPEPGKKTPDPKTPKDKDPLILLMKAGAISLIAPMLLEAAGVNATGRLAWEVFDFFRGGPAGKIDKAADAIKALDAMDELADVVKAGGKLDDFVKAGGNLDDAAKILLQKGEKFQDGAILAKDGKIISLAERHAELGISPTGKLSSKDQPKVNLVEEAAGDWERAFNKDKLIKVGGRNVNALLAEARLRNNFKTIYQDYAEQAFKKGVTRDQFKANTSNTIKEYLARQIPNGDDGRRLVFEDDSLKAFRSKMGDELRQQLDEIAEGLPMAYPKSGPVGKNPVTFDYLYRNQIEEGFDKIPGVDVDFKLRSDGIVEGVVRPDVDWRQHVPFFGKKQISMQQMDQVDALVKKYESNPYKTIPNIPIKFKPDEGVQLPVGLDGKPRQFYQAQARPDGLPLQASNAGNGGGGIKNPPKKVGGGKTPEPSGFGGLPSGALDARSIYKSSKEDIVAWAKANPNSSVHLQIRYPAQDGSGLDLTFADNGKLVSDAKGLLSYIDEAGRSYPLDARGLQAIFGDPIQEVHVAMRSLPPVVDPNAGLTGLQMLENAASKSIPESSLQAIRQQSNSLQSRWQAMQNRIRGVKPGSQEARQLEIARAEVNTRRQALSRTVAGNTGESEAALRNFAKADEMVARWAKEKAPITEARIQELNKVLGDGLIAQGSKAQDAQLGLAYGRYRNREVITRTRNGELSYLDHDEVPTAMKNLENWIQQAQAKGMPPTEVAAGAYQRMVSIHPFINGNGRTARSVMDWVLQSHGLPAAAVRDPKAAIFLGKQGNATFNAASFESSSPEASVRLVNEGIEQTISIYERALLGGSK
jgi:prophage maintenance system killer protein